MDRFAESAALLTLLRTGTLPWHEYTELVEDAGSALAVLEQGSLLATQDLTATEREIESWREAGMQLLTVLDDDYPDNLRSVHDRPPMLWVAGRLRPEDARSIAVVGTRRASPRGLDQATRISTHLASAGFTIASGLAAGVDTAAHTAALAQNARTVAVIGTGLGHSYPPENAHLQRKIAERGAVISQFWPEAPPTKRSFPMRNAVMSGVSLATVVVEASHMSGARVQARLALGHGRPVFLHERLLEQEWARACAQRPGAHVFHNPEDIAAAVDRLTSPGALTP